jgi:sphingosine kinase
VSFVLVAWGIVADVDFESERFRWMGCKMVWKLVLSLLMFLLVPAARFTVSAVQRIASLKLYRGRVSYYPDTTWKKGTCDRARCLPARDPGRPDASAPPLPRKDRSSVSGGAFAGLEVDSMPPGPPTPLLDALLAGNDAGWVHMDTDKLVMLTAANITHISADSKIAPFAQFSDGCWDLVIMNDVSKGSLLKMFLAMEKGGVTPRESCAFSEIFF